MSFLASETVKTSVSDASFGKSGPFSGIPPLSSIGIFKNFHFRCFFGELRAFLGNSDFFWHRKLQKLPFPMLASTLRKHPFTHNLPPSKQAGPARSKSTNHLPRAGPVILSTQRFKKLPQLFCQCFSRRVIVIQYFFILSSLSFGMRWRRSPAAICIIMHLKCKY